MPNLGIADSLLKGMTIEQLMGMGGSGEEDKSKTTAVKSPNRYAPFGELAETFKGEGWIPEGWNNEYTEYKPTYGLLNSIDDGKGGKGYFSIKIGNKNGVADLIMKDAQGNIIGQPLLQGVTANQINDYFTNTKSKDDYGNVKGGNINQRSNAIQNASNSGIGLAGTMLIKK